MGMFRPPPSWPPPAPTPPLRGGGRRMPWLLLFLLLFCAAFFSPLSPILNTPRGWLAVLLACAVVDFLVRHPNRGRAVVEYATVAALVFAVVTALQMAAPAPPKAKPRAAAPRPPVAQAQPDPLAGLREWVQRIKDGQPLFQLPDPKEGR